MFRFTPAVWRYKWLILSITMVGTGAGSAALPLIAPRYEAHATVTAPLLLLLIVIAVYSTRLMCKHLEI